MKLSALFLTLALTHAFAGSLAQKVTLSGKDLTYEQVFGAIKQQTGYVVLSNKDIFASSRTLSLTVYDMAIRELLDLVFTNQPYTYTIEDKTIFILKKGGATPSSLPLFTAKSEPVKGIVKDTAGVVLHGATIFNSRTKQSVQTNAQGEFVIEGEQGDILSISYTGFKKQDFKVGDGFVSVALRRLSSPLDEVQIIAYSSTSRRLNVGNVSTVKAIDIQKAPVSNALLAIQGRVPGVFIEQSTGVPGSGVKVQVQGQNSISNGNDPLYVIDGVPYPAQMLPSPSTIQQGGNPFNYLNPNDIESIDILKDADATSIYGSRAANGAILITTKKGSVGQTKTNLNFQSGIGQVAKKLDMLNTQQYLNMRKEAYVNDGLPIPDNTTLPDGTNYDLTFWDQNRNTDWQKVLIGNTAHYTDAQASVSGGSANTQFLLGGNYHRETTVFPFDFGDKKGSVYFNATHYSNNRKLHLQFSSSYMADKSDLPNVDFTQSAVELIPNAPALHNPDGTLNWAPAPDGNSTWTNPLQNTISTYTNTVGNLLANAEIGYEIIKGLTLKSTFGFNNLSAKEKSFYPQAYFPPEFRNYGNLRSANYSDKTSTSWNIEPQINYQLNKNYGRFDLLLGTTFQRVTNDLSAFLGERYASDAQLENILAAAKLTATNALQSVYNYNALFARISYNYQDKYLINLSSRRDGSSRFGAENLFHNFYSIGGAWVFSSESWADKWSFLSFGKLKLSYGTSGNDQIGDYSFMSLYNNVYADIPYGGGTGLAPTNLSNRFLQWEETRKLNFGIDLGLIGNRIVMGLNWYRNRTSNELLGYDLPMTTGFNSIKQNFDAKVQNTGFELVLTTQNVVSKAFQWTSNFNLTINRNKLLEFPGLATSTYSNTLEIGKPLNPIGTKLYQYVGVDPSTGFYQYIKADKTLTGAPEYGVDQTVIPRLTPKYYGGFQNSLTFKGISLDILFQFVNQSGTDPFRFGATWPGAFNTSATTNQPTAIADRWKKVGDATSFGRVTTQFPVDYFYLTASDAIIVDASYIRLKNLSLSWSIPREWINKMHFQNLKVYLQGQNLLTITHYQGLDPESRSVTSLPPLRVITAGVQIGL